MERFITIVNLCEQTIETYKDISTVANILNMNYNTLKSQLTKHGFILIHPYIIGYSSFHKSNRGGRGFK